MEKYRLKRAAVKRGGRGFYEGVFGGDSGTGEFLYLIS